MNRFGLTAVGVSVLALGLGGGYWLGSRHASSGPGDRPVPHVGEDVVGKAAVQMKRDRQILYYQNPDGSADYSPVPKKDGIGMDYVPVYADAVPEPKQAVTKQPAPTAPPADMPSKGKGKILYYRNAMGLPDVSPVPKKDSMGMEYVAVYEGDEDTGNTLKISLDKVQKLGVRTEAAQLRPLAQHIRAVGTVQVDESALHIVTTKFEGYIETLSVDQTGQQVRRGQPLMDIYSPDLVLAEDEYVAARQGAASLAGAGSDAKAAVGGLADAALARLQNWDIGGAQIKRLKEGGKPSRTLTLTAPVSGIVLEKRAIQGMRFMPGEPLYQIADLSTVWVIADVFEQDLAKVTVGQAATVVFSALPGMKFTGKVTFVYPTVTPETRTAKVRIVLPNHEGHLRPALYGTVEIASPLAGQPVISVPDSAVLDTGTTQTVLVERGEGLFEPRDVKLGTRAEGYVQILDGLKENEKVVVSANFLIDAESNLRAALQSFHHH
ncbi:cation efflux system protein CusB precursor [mine drainage metagenome]|uniref:Cation efflux system protein CusB n=1 Tax=mine drainage metagenome TaxID=410659 RepID=A0A1J5S8J9_9ZZZZ